jgi:hypothetical protein
MHASAQRAICLQPMRAREDVSRRMEVDRWANHSSTVTAYTAIVLSCKSPPLVERTYRCILAVTICASGYVAYNVSMMAVNRFDILHSPCRVRQTIWVSTCHANRHGRTRVLTSMSFNLTVSERRANASTNGFVESLSTLGSNIYKNFKINQIWWCSKHFHFF